MDNRLLLRKFIHILALPLLLFFYFYIDRGLGILLTLVSILFFLAWYYIPFINVIVLILRKERESILLGPIFMGLTALVLMFFPYKYAIYYAISALSIGDFLEILIREKNKSLAPFYASLIVGLASYFLSSNIYFAIYTAIVFLGIDIWGKLLLIDDNILHFLMTSFLIIAKFA